MASAPDDDLMPEYKAGLRADEAGDFEAAAGWYRKVVQQVPENVGAYCNLARSLAGIGQLDEAEANFRKALLLDPAHGVSRFYYAMLRLKRGDFATGWLDYEFRWGSHGYPGEPNPYHLKRWVGQSLQGRTILVNREHGFGDAIQFCRYCSLMKAQGATVWVEAQPTVAHILRRCRGVDAVVIEGNEILKPDYSTPLMSLPGIFGTTLETIPADVPYLSIAEQQSLARFVASLPGFKIGIAWTGSGGGAVSDNRSVPLKNLSSLAAVPGVRLISLQRGAKVDDFKNAGFEALVLPNLDDGRPFMDTAEIMTTLDLVITSDTSIAHLAGALGVPVWVALTFSPDWRWLLNRSDSPWYPTMRLFRQRNAGDWQQVFGEIEIALRQTIKDAYG
jgi:hypothetical protein